jgi:hypothetical protein
MARGRRRRADVHPTEFQGQDSKGNVRPADNRFLTDAQIDKRDEYVAEETGPQAQQLLAKDAEVADTDLEPDADQPPPF